MAKDRLDIAMMKAGLVPSRERARTLIMEGRVLVNGQKVEKAGTQIADGAQIRLLGEDMPYVSRGGFKLEKAIREFGLSLEGKTVADIGASTGGFTDCALQHGAAKVFAIDVGYGQLAWKLRNDPCVISMERMNIRYVTPSDLGEHVDLASIDVSFISLEKVLPVVRELLSPEGEAVALIKPQFEAGRERVGKKGVVRDPSVHEDVICAVAKSCVAAGLPPAGLTFSPIKGPEGNIEYLIWLRPEGSETEVTKELIARTVKSAHETLAANGI